MGFDPHLVFFTFNKLEENRASGRYSKDMTPELSFL